MKRISIAFLSLFLCVASVWSMPRPEYPRPQFERAGWVNLNGEWTCSFDFGGSGMEREFYKSKGFDKKITVPFCPESKLSGIGYTDFINHFWYQRPITIPQEWNGKNILLNFGAVYYKSEVYIDGVLANRHFGGTSSFAVDITSLVKPGQTLVWLFMWRATSVGPNKQPANRICNTLLMAATTPVRPVSGRRSGWKRSIRKDCNRFSF